MKKTLDSFLGRKRRIAMVTIAVGAMISTQAPAAIVDGLVNYWSLDGGLEDEAEGLAGSASTVDDELNISHPGALGTTLDFSDNAKFGLALDFDDTSGENDGHLFANPSQDVVGAVGVGGFLDGNMSISVWAQASVFDAGWQAIAAHGEGGGYRLHRRDSESIAAFTGNSSGDTDPISGGVDISPGTGWHHFVARVSDNVAQLWVDGRLQGQEAEGAPEDRGNGIHIGMNPDTSGREWKGQIDDLGMWHRPLTDDEITEIYLKGLQGIPLLGDPPIMTLFPTSPVLPGPSGSNGMWGIREIRNNGTIDSIAAARDSATNGGGNITDGASNILDLTDPDSNADGGPHLTGAPLAFLTDTVGSVDDNITSIAKGTIRVPEGKSGLYTLQVDSKDGAGIRVVGQEWASVNGAGVIDPNDPTAIVSFDGGTARGVIDLAPGDYDVELISWGGEDSGHYEVTSAQGERTKSSGVQWLPLGDPTEVPEQTVKPLVSLPDPVIVANGGASGSIAEARVEAFNALGGGLVKEADALVLHDPGAGCPNGPGQVAAVADVGIPFPISDIQGAGQDNFTTGIFGQIEVDNGNETPGELIQLTIGMFSDDRAQLRIVGESFSTTAGDANTSLVDVDGDLALTGDFDTCNTNSIGHIMLEEGVYAIEGLHTEAGGDAGWQIWYAEGIVDVAGAPMVPVTVPPTLPANSGLGLVGGVGPACDFDGNGVCELPDINELMYTGLASGDSKYDLNGDEVVDLGDRDEWYRQAGSLPGDANLDGVNNAMDLNPIGVNWQSSGITSIADGDNNGDGVVNAADLNDLGIWWTFTAADFLAAAPAANAAVPEPTGVTLCLAGLFGLMLLRRKN